MTGRGFSKVARNSLLVLILVFALPAVLLAQSETETPVPPAATEEPAAAPTSAPVSTLTVTGSITNGTAGGTVPADVTVLLRTLGSDGAQTAIPAVVAADGTFSVPDVPIFPESLYVATAEYQGVTFSSMVAAGADLMSAATLPLVIYEVTDDPSVLSITQLQAQAAVSTNEMQVLELYSFGNSSDRAYVAPDGASVRVTAPEGAQIFDMGTTRFLVSEDGRQLIDSAPVMPGEDHTVHILYQVPYGGQATVTHPVNYPLVNGFEVVISDPGLSVTAEGMEALGGRDMGMAFGVQASIPAGGDVSFTVSGTPAPVAAQTAPTDAEVAAAHSAAAPSIPPLSLVLMVIGGACVGVAIVLFIRDRRRKPVAVAPVDPRVNVLVQQIAELDVSFQAGQISQEDYDKQRTALKSQLMGLARDGAEG